jgi:hypothetical protein
VGTHQIKRKKKEVIVPNNVSERETPSIFFFVFFLVHSLQKKQKIRVDHQEKEIRKKKMDLDRHWTTLTLCARQVLSSYIIFCSLACPHNVSRLDGSKYLTLSHNWLAPTRAYAHPQLKGHITTNTNS